MYHCGRNGKTHSLKRILKRSRNFEKFRQDEDIIPAKIRSLKKSVM